MPIYVNQDGKSYSRNQLVVQLAEPSPTKQIDRQRIVGDIRCLIALAIRAMISCAAAIASYRGGGSRTRGESSIGSIAIAAFSRTPAKAVVRVPALSMRGKGAGGGEH